MIPTPKIENARKILFIGIIIFGIILMVISIILIAEEVSGAKNFCKSVDGEYMLNFNPKNIGHACNSEPILKYSSGWNFKSRIDTLSDLSVELPIKQ